MCPVSKRTHRSLADAECENLFVNEHRRLSDGRYVARLPRKTTIGVENLGYTLVIAQQAFRST